MTTTSAVKNHRSLPRQKHAPSARDQAIFLAYRTQGRTQAQLAEGNQLSQRRISQIIRRTQHWLEHGLPVLLTSSDPYAMAVPSSDSIERQRLERRLARERDQAIYDRALHQHDHQPASLVTTVEFFSQEGEPATQARSASEGKPPHSPTNSQSPSSLTPDPCPLTPSSRPPSRLTRTTRQIAPSAQFLRLAIRASAQLKRTESQEPLPSPRLEMDPHQKLALLLKLLCAFRREAEQDHKVVKTDDHITIVEQWLAALLGDQPCSLSDADLAPGSPLAELSEFYPRFLRSLKTSPWEGEAPAEPDDPSSWGGPPAGPKPTRSVSEGQPSDLEPETCNHSSDASNASNPSSSAPPLTPSPSTTSTSSPTFDLRPSTFDTAPPTPTRSVSEGLPPKTENQQPKPLTPYQRRLAHERKLEQLKEFRRLGLPIMLEFDPEDGPLPTIHHPGDHYITTPGIFDL